METLREFIGSVQGLLYGTAVLLGIGGAAAVAWMIVARLAGY